MKETVLELLASGNIYAGKQLSRFTGLHDADVRRVIHDLRCDGIVVCSCRRGYYLPTDKGEIEKTIASLERRIKQITDAVEGLKRATSAKGGDAKCHV